MDEKSHHFKPYFGDVDILSNTNIHPKNPGHEHRQNQNLEGLRKTGKILHVFFQQILSFWAAPRFFWGFLSHLFGRIFAPQTRSNGN